MSEELRHYYLHALGIDLWLQKPKTKSNANSLAKLAKEVAECTRCPLHATRTQTVFSRGNAQAKLMIIGEAPGFYEDQQGLPFVGKSGELLNQMLLSIGLKEDDVYIANVLKCRTPDNRDPEAFEIEQCTGFLKQQMELINPNLILALGQFAGQFLMGKALSLNQIRGKAHQFHEKPFLVSFHPDYLLRNPRDKKLAYADLLAVRTYL